MKTMDTTKKTETYKLPCSVCKGKQNFKIIAISRRSGIKLECSKCGKTVHKNSKYLEGKKNGDI